MIAGLHQELDHVAERLGALVRIVHALREENQTLRHAVERSEAENKLLKERVDAARERVESLLQRLPGDA